MDMYGAGVGAPGVNAEENGVVAARGSCRELAGLYARIYAMPRTHASHPDPAGRPGVAPPHVEDPPPFGYGFGVFDEEFHAGVLPPLPWLYGFGVRAVASHAGVFPVSL